MVYSACASRVYPGARIGNGRPVRGSERERRVAPEPRRPRRWRAHRAAGAVRSAAVRKTV